MLLRKTWPITNRPLKWGYYLFFKLVILPIFGQYIWIKNKFAKKASNFREKIILTLINRYVIHLIILVLAISVATANLLAYENQENYGQDALIYEILGLKSLEIITETTPLIYESKIYSYLGETSQIGAIAFTETQKMEEEFYWDQYRSDLTVTLGDSALAKPDLVSTEAAKITRTSVREYIVEEGDTIGAIAVRFNVSVNTILWSNNLSFNSYIRPGQKLIIPPTTGVIHKIARGDTLSAIAKKYEADVNKIKEFNNIENDGALVIGEMIMVPGGRIIYTARPKSFATAPVSAPAFTTPIVPSDGKMYWPSSCQRITQYFRSWIHTGIDIACGGGNPIRAAESGVVSRVQYANYGYGYNITINHGGGKQTLYAHLSRILVENGQQISKGQVIGLEGSTGRSTGPHLHFEVIINGLKVNPLNYLR